MAQTLKIMAKKVIAICLLSSMLLSSCMTHKPNHYKKVKRDKGARTYNA